MTAANIGIRGAGMFLRRDPARRLFAMTTASISAPSGLPSWPTLPKRTMTTSTLPDGGAIWNDALAAPGDSYLVGASINVRGDQTKLMGETKLKQAILRLIKDRAKERAAEGGNIRVSLLVGDQLNSINLDEDLKSSLREIAVDLSRGANNALPKLEKVLGQPITSTSSEASRRGFELGNEFLGQALPAIRKLQDVYNVDIDVIRWREALKFEQGSRFAPARAVLVKTLCSWICIKPSTSDNGDVRLIVGLRPGKDRKEPPKWVKEVLSAAIKMNDTRTGGDKKRAAKKKGGPAQYIYDVENVLVSIVYFLHEGPVIHALPSDERRAFTHFVYPASKESLRWFFEMGIAIDQEVAAPFAGGGVDAVDAGSGGEGNKTSFNFENYIELEAKRPTDFELDAEKETETQNLKANHYMVNWLQSGAASFACIKVYEELRARGGPTFSKGDLIWFCPELTLLYDKKLALGNEEKIMEHFACFWTREDSEKLQETWREVDISSITLASDHTARVHDRGVYPRSICTQEPTLFFKHGNARPELLMLNVHKLAIGYQDGDDIGQVVERGVAWFGSQGMPLDTIEAAEKGLEESIKKFTSKGSTKWFLFCCGEPILKEGKIWAERSQYDDPI